MAIEYDGEIYQLVNAEDDVDSNTIPDEADQCLDALLSGAVDMHENERAECKKRFEKCSRKKLRLFCDYLRIQDASSFGKADLVRKIFDWVEHKAAEGMHKKNQEEELKKRRKLGGPSYGDIQTALWKALKIAGKRKPHNNLVKIASTILEKKLDAEDEKVKRALLYVLENFDGNWREGSSKQ
ncbi:hypothetical protein C5167_021996 [Papaver somniferum]|uniref:Uncharacterized protein n=1 Tax=Papaver somniferum TaxID=3469 RepID=A0A4Y7JKD8_PAPSO|nr:hypothetical protein C5167_021996 [Papaver somniferum]